MSLRHWTDYTISIFHNIVPKFVFVRPRSRVWEFNPYTNVVCGVFLISQERWDPSSTLLRTERLLLCFRVPITVRVLGCRSVITPPLNLNPPERSQCTNRRYTLKVSTPKPDWNGCGLRKTEGRRPSPKQKIWRPGILIQLYKGVKKWRSRWASTGPASGGPKQYLTGTNL